MIRLARTRIRRLTFSLSALLLTAAIASAWDEPVGETAPEATASPVVISDDEPTRFVEQSSLDPAVAAEVVCLAFAPDGKTLASAGRDGTVRLWDVPSRSERAVLRDHESIVQCVAFAPDGRTLATAGSDATFRLWETARGLERMTFRGHDQDVFAVAFAPDGRTLASTGQDGTLRLWSVPTSQTGPHVSP